MDTLVRKLIENEAEHYPEFYSNVAFDDYWEEILFEAIEVDRDIDEEDHGVTVYSVVKLRNGFISFSYYKSYDNTEIDTDSPEVVYPKEVMTTVYTNEKPDSPALKFIKELALEEGKKYTKNEQKIRVLEFMQQQKPIRFDFIGNESWWQNWEYVVLIENRYFAYTYVVVTGNFSPKMHQIPFYEETIKEVFPVTVETTIYREK